MKIESSLKILLLATWVLGAGANTCVLCLDHKGTSFLSYQSLDSLVMHLCALLGSSSWNINYIN